jgi:glycosyltransferase involved in cell wall biosynthesis
MRIGVDARELCGHATGAGRYLHGLLLQWAAAPRAAAHEFLLYAPDAPTSIDAALDVRRFPRRLVPGAPGTWWEQTRLPRAAQRDRVDVFFAPAYTAPLWLDVPTVVAIHDVSFAAHPEWYRFREGLRRRWISRASARRASAIITISAFSRREIETHFGIPSGVIHVVPPGITPPGALPGPPAVPGRTGDPRVLFVGSIFNRRHVPELIRAVVRLARRRPGVSLDIVGDNRSYPRERLDALIAARDAGAIVRWRHYVADEELGRLYARARAFAFLSEYEGLGLTPLEALAAGVPPLVLDTEVAREACGPAAAYVAAPDTAAIADALERVLFDERERQRILTAGPGVLAVFDWVRAAERTLAILEEA